MQRHFLCAVCLVLLLAAPAAFGQADFADVVSFGDSLTHNEWLWLVYENPPGLYGPDPINAVFDKGAGSRDNLTSYALGGSESWVLPLQVATYVLLNALRFQDRATLFSVEIGGNDILNNRYLLAAHPPGQDAEADAVIDRLTRNLRISLAALWLSSPRADFVVWTVPDITLTPKLASGFSPDELANLQAHTERTNQFIRSLGDFSSVVVFDLYALLPAVVVDPPVLLGHPLVPPPAFGEFDNLFADEIHPTAVANALMANAIIELINETWNDSIPQYSESELATLARIPP